MIAAAVQDLKESIPGLDSLTSGPTGTWKEVLLILAVSLGVGLLCFVVFLIFRKNKGDLATHRHPGASRSRSHSLFGGDSRRRRRQPREEFEHRNPTRAEVGGFPELRDEPNQPNESRPQPS